MARLRAKFNSATIKRWIAEGRGQGRGEKYLSWLRVQDVPSLGYVNRILGWKTRRRHEFLSNLETKCFYLLEWSTVVSDVREQFPLLPLDETLAIAQQCGIKHPTLPGTNQPIVMTTDFLIDVVQNGATTEHARTVKPSKELLSDRTLEKFEIERRYWFRRKVDWAVITERDIPQALVKNIEWIHQYRNISEKFDVSAAEIQRVEIILGDLLQQRIPLNESTRATDQRLGLEPGRSLAIFRHLLACRRWQINMDDPIDFRKPITLLNQPIIAREENGPLCKHAA
jgi:hypothetical protein